VPKRWTTSEAKTINWQPTREEATEGLISRIAEIGQLNIESSKTVRRLARIVRMLL